MWFFWAEHEKEEMGGFNGAGLSSRAGDRLKREHRTEVSTCPSLAAAAMVPKTRAKAQGQVCKTDQKVQKQMR